MKTGLRQVMLFFLLLLCFLYAGEGTGQNFGKNKVQFKNFEWYYIQTRNFDIYFSKSGEEIAWFTASAAEKALKNIEQDLDYRVKRRIPIIVYNSHNDFQQTNVIEELIPEGVGGFTEYFKHRIVIPFEGSYEDYRHVIHHELVHAVVFDMFYGRGLPSIIGIQAMMQLPLWLGEGLAEYESAYWDTKADMLIRDATINNYLPDIEFLSDYFAYKGGQSVLKYINEKYGRAKVGELLTRIKESKRIEGGLKETLGVEAKKLSEEWKKNLRKEYWPDIKYRKEAKDFARRLTDHEKWSNYYNASPAISPAGDKVAFLTDKNDFADIYVVSTLDPSILKKVVSGQRSSDFEELHWLRPGISWDPEGRRLIFAAKQGAKDVLYIVDAQTGHVESENSFNLDGIFSPSMSKDGKKIAFVGLLNGNSDIYYVEINSGKVVNITNDQFTDLEPSWSPDNERIVFTSDRNGLVDSRSQDFPAIQDINYRFYDVYEVDLQNNNSIRRITNSPAREENPVYLSDGKSIAYSSDECGVFNIYIQNSDNERYPVTNVLSGCFNISISSDDSKLSFSSLNNGGWDVFVMENPLNVGANEIVLERTEFMKQGGAQILQDYLYKKPETQNDVTKNELHGVDVRHFIFESEAIHNFEAAVENDSTGSKDQGGGSKEEPKKSDEDDKITDGKYKIKDYTPKFSPDIIYGNAAYSQYFGVLGSSYIAVSDILGNHRFYFSSNLFFDLENSDFSLYYFYLPRRIDYGFGAFHNAYLFLTDNDSYIKKIYAENGKYAGNIDYMFFRDRVYGINTMFSRPFSKFTRIDASLSLFSIQRSFPYEEVNLEDIKKNLIIPGLSLVHDTIVWGETNPVNGVRGSLSFLSSPGLGHRGMDFRIYSADVRKYLKIKNDYSFAMRLTSGFSEGKDSQKFFLGGMDNWINQSFVGDEIKVEDVGDIYFSTFVTPMRGGDFYEKIGTKYFLTNLEFRFPLIKYFALGWPLPIRISNIGGALFTDIGSAWYVNSHFKGIEKLSSGRHHLDDIFLGYGLGARLNLGIFILKFDMGWNTDFVENSSKPKYYFSLGPGF